MASIEMNGSVIMGGVTFLVTFLLVIFSYIFLFKRRSSSSAAEKPTTGNCDPPKQSETNTSNSENKQKLPKPAGLCPFAALADMTEAPSAFEHIPSKVKKTEKERIQKEIEKNMSDADCAKEREVQREQMRQIYELMQGNKETFGISDMKEMDNQMKLYM